MATTVRELVTVLRYKTNEAGLKKYNNQLKTTTKRAKAGERALGSMAAAARRMVGAYLGVAGVRGLLQVTGQMQQLNTQLRQTVPNLDKFAAAQKRLFQISQNTASPLQKNLEQFTQLRRTMQGSGTTIEQQLDMFAAIQAGVAASGGSAGEANKLMRRFARSMAEGAVDGSTLRAMVDANAAGFNALVKGLQKTAPELGVTRDNIRDLANQGKLTTDIVLPAMSAGLDDLRKKADDIPLSLADAMTKLRNSFAQTLGSSQDAQGALSGIVKGIDLISKHVDQLLGPGIAVGAGLFARMFGVRALPVTMAVLFGQDLLSWLRGDNSIIGQLIGPVEEHQEALDNIKSALGGIKSVLSWIKDNIFGQKDTPFSMWATELIFIGYLLRVALGTIRTMRNAALITAGAFGAMDAALLGGAGGRALGKGSKAARGATGATGATGARAAKGATGAGIGAASTLRYAGWMAAIGILAGELSDYFMPEKAKQANRENHKAIHEGYQDILKSYQKPPLSPDQLRAQASSNTDNSQTNSNNDVTNNINVTAPSGDGGIIAGMIRQELDRSLLGGVEAVP